MAGGEVRVVAVSLPEHQGDKEDVHLTVDTGHSCGYKTDKARQGLFQNLGQGVQSTRTSTSTRTKQGVSLSPVYLWIQDRQGKTRIVPEPWPRCPVDKDKYKYKYEYKYKYKSKDKEGRNFLYLED